MFTKPRSIFVFLMLLGASVLAATDRPNIVWIVTEDNSANYLRLYDEEGGAPMPNVERLAKQGIVFNHAFSNAPVCSVARSTIISGCYVPRLFAQYHRKTEMVPMPDGLMMFPWYLREAGYYATNNHKEDYNFIKTEGVWDDSSKNASFRNRKPGQPFFHVQNFGTTHEGRLHFSKEEMDAYQPKTDLETVPVYECHPETELFKYTNAYYRDLHMKVDKEIGTFLKQLEDDGLMDDTIIFYYGDHGGVLPGSKGYIYEQGLHVPMVVYAPEKWKHLLPAETGSRVDGFVQFVDLGPTVLNLAGVDVPEQVNGTPFLGDDVYLEELNSRDAAFGYADRFDEKYDFVRTLRRGKFKYMRNYQPFNYDGLHNDYRYKMLAYNEWRDLYAQGKLNAAQSHFFQVKGAEELYDVEADPREINNLANDPKYQKVLKSLRKQLRNHVKQLPDLSFYPESQLLNEARENPYQFGQEHKAEIATLVDIADLAFLTCGEAKDSLLKAIHSESEWERYWGWIVCSTFIEQASTFKAHAKKTALKDPSNLVRMRAAEFMGLAGFGNPEKVLVDCLKSSSSPTEANLILNTVALLRDGPNKLKIEVDPTMLPKEWQENNKLQLHRRFGYLSN